MKTIRRLERLAYALTKLDVRGPDFRIAKSEFDLLVNDSQALSHMTGKQNVSNDWEAFRDLFVSYNADLGFNWERTRGPFGPVELQSVDLLPIIGEELAEDCHSKGVEEGSFQELLYQELPYFYAYLKDFSNSLSHNQAKSAFSSFTKNNFRYKFNTRSMQFEHVIERYYYQASDTRRTEIELGEAILQHVKNALSLNFLYHAQEGRELGKYQNVDLEGLKINTRYAGDEALLYNFELKPSNSIDYVSEAISQAINYKEFSNFTYIVIPLFDTLHFYDPERFSNFVKLASDNDLGILSIDLDPDTHKIKGINEMAGAKRRDIINPQRMNYLLNKSNREYCPLCRKVVTKDASRDPCGWRVTLPRELEDSDAESCMKRLMESKFLQN